MEPTRVVVGVSGSLGGLQALRYAVNEARRRESIVHAVRAWQFTAPWRGYDTDLCRQDMSAAAEAAIHSTFDTAMGGLPPDLTFVLVTTIGPAGPALVTIADRDDDLLVVGASRGRWSDGAAVVRHCVRRASCPVLVVPAPTMVRRRGTRALTRELQREVRAAVNRPL